MLHDLTINLDENTVPFPDSGDPNMKWKCLVDHSFYKCQVSEFTMVTHLGTHVDAPLHYVENGKSTSQMDLSAYCGEATCLEMTDIPTEGTFDISEYLDKHHSEIRQGEILLLYTGWENKLNTEEYFKFPDFHENTGEVLQKYGIKGIGFDLPSIDRTGDAHQSVLSRDIGIYESLINLAPLIDKRFFFSAVPLKFTFGDGSPVRAYAITED